MVAMKKTDFETLTSITLPKVTFAPKKAEVENAVLNDKCISLEARNIELTEENNILSGNLKQLEMDFDNFAYSVQSETRLSGIIIGYLRRLILNHFNATFLKKERAELIEENTKLKSDAEDSKEQIRSLHENLTTVQSALKAFAG